MNAQTLLRCLIAMTVISLQQASLADVKNPSVLVKEGNIYLQKVDKSLVQLTKSGKDRNPVLSPDGKTLAFIRETDEKYEPDHDAAYEYPQEYTDQLWVGHINGEPQKVHPKKGETSYSKILDNSVQFSPDGNKIYFLKTEWTTSCAVHTVDSDGSGLRLLIPGNSLRILPKGIYKGHLIVQQHRYFVGGGSFDWYWLFDPNGKEIGPIGPDLTEDLIEMLISYE